MFLNFGLSDVFSWTNSGYIFFERNIIRVMLCSSCILLSGTQFWFVPLLVMLTVNTWLEWYLPSFSSVKLPFFTLQPISILWGGVFNYVNIPPISFNIHWCFLAELIIKMMVTKWLFFNSIISSISICWHSTIKKSFILFLYLYQYWFIDSCFIQWVI